MRVAGCRVQGEGCRVQGEGFRVWGGHTGRARMEACRMESALSRADTAWMRISFQVDACSYSRRKDARRNDVVSLYSRLESKIEEEEDA